MLPIYEDSTGLRQYLTRAEKASGQPILKHLTRSAFSNFNKEQDMMSLGRSNVGSGSQTVHIARKSKKCIDYRKWKIEDSFNWSFTCRESDNNAKRREENRKRRGGKELLRMQRGKNRRHRILSMSNPSRRSTG